MPSRQLPSQGGAASRCWATRATCRVRGSVRVFRHLFRLPQKRIAPVPRLPAGRPNSWVVTVCDRENVGSDPALLRTSGRCRKSPFPGHTCPAAKVTDMPRAMKRFGIAARTCTSATRRPRQRAVRRSPRDVHGGHFRLDTTSAVVSAPAARLMRALSTSRCSGPFELRLWDRHVPGLLSAAQGAEVGHRPAKPGQFQKARHDLRCLPMGHPEKGFDREAGRIAAGLLKATLSGWRSVPHYRRIEQDGQRPTLSQRAVAVTTVRGSVDRLCGHAHLRQLPSRSHVGTPGGLVQQGDSARLFPCPESAVRCADSVRTISGNSGRTGLIQMTVERAEHYRQGQQPRWCSNRTDSERPVSGFQTPAPTPAQDRS